MTAEERFQQFRPFWIIRTIWLLVLLLLVWREGIGDLLDLPLLAVIGALLLQLLLLALALLRRVLPGHDLLSTSLASVLASLMLYTYPNLTPGLMLFGVIPLLDLAFWRGWTAWLLLVLFPLPVLPSLFTEGPTLFDLRVGALWTIAAFLAIAIATSRRPSRPAVEAPKARVNVQEADSILAKVAQMLVRETNYERILQALVRGASETLDSRKHRARAMAFTFKPGLRDLLVVTAMHNMDSNYGNRSYQLVGVLGTLLQDGEPIETDGEQAPFNEMRLLKDHRILLFPLRTGIDVYGAVMVATKDEARAADHILQRTLIALADQASLALHNAVLQQELRRNRDRRITGEEEARHQLARDLHDGPVQRVAAITMQLEFIKALMKKDPGRAMDEVNQLQEVAKQASQEMRTMLFTLRPVVLESEGLTAAVEALVGRLREQEKLNIGMEADPLPRLDAKVEDVAFAIMQEAIGNAKKYAGNHPIRVRLIKGQSMVVGQVEDEGPGFDLKAVTANYGNRASLGLLNMHERASMVGGQLKIDTAPGRGTIVSIAVPFERD